MKTKNFMLKLFIMVGFLTVQNTLAQVNIGEFNRNEIKIQIDLNETDKVLNSEYYDMTRASREKDFTVTDMNQHIDKLKQLALPEAIVSAAVFVASLSYSRPS